MEARWPARCAKGASPRCPARRAEGTRLRWLAGYAEGARLTWLMGGAEGAEPKVAGEARVGGEGGGARVEEPKV